MRIGDVNNPYNPTLAETADQVKISSSKIEDNMSSASPAKWLAVGTLFLFFCAALWKFLSGTGSSRSSSSTQPQEQEKASPQTTGALSSLSDKQKRALDRYRYMKVWLQSNGKNVFYSELQHVLNNVSDEEIQKHLDESNFSEHRTWKRPDEAKNLSPEMFFVLVRYFELALKKDPLPIEEAKRTATNLQQQYKDLRRS